MFEFLKKLMTNNESVSAKETNFLHRILNTDITEEPKSQEDAIISVSYTHQTLPTKRIV